MKALPKGETINVTENLNFYAGHEPKNLIEKYESPLYVYNENIFRQKCKDMKNIVSYENFQVNYAIKANTNLTLLSIAREEGLCADVSSSGEIVAAMAAGFLPNEIIFIANNISAKEMLFAIEKGILISVDSISQLETYGKIAKGSNVAIRFNSGIGGGHHEKVITGGDGTKFGIMPEYIPQIKEILKKYNLKLVGINHHIGSQNWGDLYIDGVKELLNIAYQFKDLEFIDLGGGFAIPYNKQNGEKPLNLEVLKQLLESYMNEFKESYGKNIKFMIEPGRYIAAECGIVLGTVNSIKTNGEIKYAGTDVGFSVFARPTLYDAHHDIEIYRQSNNSEAENIKEEINIVGNQCESGDYIAKERYLNLKEEDIIAILDAGAYGYSMSSNYNHRPRPAEVLIREDGSLELIRKRESLEDIIKNMIDL
ncbi:MAG: diaminopimelate decarboxylase [Defluviitaleaceae bacterium]|nr:diaminopimelate decarboxylase [Defluviitaleaceae bacterium]